MQLRLRNKIIAKSKRVLRKINSAKASTAKLAAVKISADPSVDLPENAPRTSLPKQPTLWVPDQIQNEEAFLKIQTELTAVTRKYHIECAKHVLAAKSLTLEHHTKVFDALDSDFTKDLVALFEDTAISANDKTSIIDDAQAKYTVNRGTVIAEVETERIKFKREKENRKQKVADAKLKALESTDDKSLGKFWDKKMSQWENRHEITPKEPAMQELEENPELVDMQLNADFDKQVKKVAGPQPKNGKATPKTPVPPKKQGNSRNHKSGGKRKGNQRGGNTEN